MKLRRCPAFVLAVGAALAATPTPEAFVRELDAWRADRVARLTAADGWLTLTGLHFLQAGANTVGSAPDNDLVLASGPARAGTATLAADGRVTFAPAADAGVRIDGQAVPSAELHPGGAGRATLVTADTVSFFVIDRSGKKALRVRDSAAARRTQFAGIDYFPADPAWRIEARWVAFEPVRMIPITNVLGQTTPAPVPGKAVFEREGRTYELWPIDEGPGQPLFFVISDGTSGRETYGGGRFLYAEPPRDGKVVLDFNRLQSPPCAFTPFATCPLPPKENRLPLTVTAGEKNYRGAHD